MDIACLAPQTAVNRGLEKYKIESPPHRWLTFCAARCRSQAPCGTGAQWLPRWPRGMAFEALQARPEGVRP